MWQPIETAPRDGTPIIGRGFYTRNGQTPMLCVAMVGGRDGIWWRDNNGYGFTVSCHPTHWMPIPEDPK